MALMVKTERKSRIQVDARKTAGGVLLRTASSFRSLSSNVSRLDKVDTAVGFVESKVSLGCRLWRTRMA